MEENKQNFKFAGMIPFLALNDLKLIFTDREKAVEVLLQRSSTGAFQFFKSEHLPLLFFFPLFSLISPYRWIIGKKIKFITDFILPAAAVMAVLLIAVIYDKIMEHSSGPEIEPADSDHRKNISLFLHLAVASSSVFYLIHPFAGFSMIVVSALFSIILSIRAYSLYRGITPARSLIYYLWACVFTMIPLLILSAVVNVLRSIDILGDLI
ncbi:MAG: hypothetical protein OEZ34_07095 [Spirochaetia bacterium]|nr:hypothetical protein [Spirochaetia bacterium]